VLDDICMALGNARNHKNIPSLEIQSLCPIIELTHVYPELFLKHGTTFNKKIFYKRYAELISSIGAGDLFYKSADSKIQYSSMSLFSSESTVWTSLAIEIKKFAMHAGFSGDYSGKFAGAILELHDNIIEHSKRVDTGYIVFEALPDRFDFVVADRGIGVLSGLRNNPVYSDLNDAGVALEEALTYGVSGTGMPDRGAGFKPTIEGLANIAHSIRFRTGDHGRVYLRNANDGIEASTSQKVPIEGFLASVSCNASMV